MAGGTTFNVLVTRLVRVTLAEHVAKPVVRAIEDTTLPDKPADSWDEAQGRYAESVASQVASGALVLDAVNSRVLQSWGVEISSAPAQTELVGD